MKKRMFTFALAFVCCIGISACSKNVSKNAEPNVTEPSNNENVIANSSLCDLEMPGIAKIDIKSFDIISDEIESETCIAFNMQYTNLADDEACFNDIGSREGILHFSQDGIELEPRRVSKTSNIGYTVSKNNSVDVVKAYALINTTSDVTVEFKDDAGNVISSSAISISK